MPDDWGPLGRPLALMKFGREPDMRTLLRGEVYLNTLAHFAKVEADELRGDVHEALALYKPMHGLGKLQILNEESAQWDLVGTINWLTIPDADARAAHAFCMYAFREGHAVSLVDEKNFKFGDACVVFTEGDEFIRRVQRAAARDGFTFEKGLIVYVSPDYDGRMGPFRKFSTFSYQSEFRILFKTGRHGPVTLDVGDLSDLARIRPVQSLNRRIVVDQIPAAGRMRSRLRLFEGPLPGENHAPDRAR